MNRSLNILSLLFALLTFVSPVDLSAVNAAPSPTDFPKHLMSLPMETLMNKGVDYKRMNRPDSALMCFVTLSNRLGEAAGDREWRMIVDSKIEAGKLYYSVFYDYGKAYSFFQDAYDIAESKGYYDCMSLSLNNIGNVLSVYSVARTSEKQTEEILDCYIRGLDYAIKSKNWMATVPVLNNMMAMAMDSICLRRMAPSLKRFYNLNVPDTVADIRFTKGRVGGYLDMEGGNYDGASVKFRTLLADKDGIAGSSLGMIQVYFDLAGLYSVTGNPDSTLYYARKVQKMSEEEGLYEVIPGACLMEADIYASIGDRERSDEAMLRYYSYKDSLLQLSDISLFSEPHLKKRIADIDVELVKVVEESRRRRIVIISVSALLVLAVVSVVVMMRKNKALMRKNREMAERSMIIDRQDRIILHHKIDEMRRQPDDNRRGNPELLAKIVDVMEHDEEIFSPEFSLDRLAQICGEKSKIVSGELNASLGKNFNTLLNEYRIREMCRRLEDDQYSSFTIEAVSQSVGFRSRSTYVSAFKKQTGLTPSEYIKAKNKG